MADDDAASSLLALRKEAAQPMGLSAHDFQRWLPRAQAAVARAEGTSQPRPGGTGPASAETPSRGDPRRAVVSETPQRRPGDAS